MSMFWLLSWSFFLQESIIPHKFYIQFYMICFLWWEHILWSKMTNNAIYDQHYDAFLIQFHCRLNQQFSIFAMVKSVQSFMNILLERSLRLAFCITLKFFNGIGIFFIVTPKPRGIFSCFVPFLKGVPFYPK